MINRVDIDVRYTYSLVIFLRVVVTRHDPALDLCWRVRTEQSECAAARNSK